MDKAIFYILIQQNNIWQSHRILLVVCV